ncbi:hypothetical protein HUT18_12200 [Streptomyces sp. NA04227]|nr:hypothetical protein HUT18_12200 [Streptomyces sp. NA04227]
MQGWTYDRIQLELGCSKSSISLWVRDLPKPEPRYTPEEQQALMNKGLARLHADQARERTQLKDISRQEIGRLTDRELFVAGVALYWAEGQKSKSYARREAVIFCNSDSGVVSTFLAWLELLRVDRSQLRFRVMIHENADLAAAEAHWSQVVGVAASDFQRATLKKHNPKTVRRNVSEGYHGCLTVRVLQAADLYCRIEGWWYGIVEAAGR